MLARADEHADLMQGGGDAEDELKLGIEAVEVLQLAEELLREHGDVLGVFAIGLVAVADLAGGLQHLLLEDGGAGAGGHEVEHELGAEVAGGHPDAFIAKAFGEREIGLQGGHDAFAAGMKEKSFVDFMNQRGLTIRYMSTKDLTDFVARERPFYEALATEVAKTRQ